MNEHSQRRWGMIADDVTGACDAGVVLAKRGVATTVVLDVARSPAPGAGLTVLCTNTRSLEPHEAATRAGEAFVWLKRQRVRLIYKKIDSTCKGHVGVELNALLRRGEWDVATVMPAFPAMGRIVLNGWLRWHDGTNMRSVHLPTLLAEQGVYRARARGRPGRVRGRHGTAGEQRCSA